MFCSLQYKIGNRFAAKYKYRYLINRSRIILTFKYFVEISLLLGMSIYRELSDYRKG